MKQVKNLRIKTKEGFEIRNLKRFPSMEWGEEGGLEAEVYLDGENLGTLYQAGNGGCASFTYPNSEAYKKIAEKGIVFLQRVDKAYGPNSPYDWLKKKTAKSFDDDDIEAIVTTIEERYDDVTVVKKLFKKGYKAVALLKNDHSTHYLQYRVVDITLPEVTAWLKKNKMLKEYPTIEIIRDTDNLAIL